MIEKQAIDGKDATVAYLTAEFKPATKDNYAMVNVIVANGKVVFAKPAAQTPQGSASASMSAMTKRLSEKGKNQDR